MDTATTYADRLTAIHAHLDAGGKVMTVTYARGTVYSQKHRDWFTANSAGLYVRSWKSTVCLNFTPVKFSVL